MCFLSDDKLPPSVKRYARVKADPTKKVPKEELDNLPSLFINKELVKKICAQVKAQDGNVALASEQVARAIIHMASLGLTNRVISQNLGVSKRRVEITLESQSVRAEVERLQNLLFKRDYEEMFKRLVPTAVQNIFDLMVKKSNKESTRLEAAKYIVDRAIGKPKETVIQKTDLIAEVFQSLSHPKDKASQNQPIEAEFENVTNQEGPKDPLEEMLGSK